VEQTAAPTPRESGSSARSGRYLRRDIRVNSFQIFFIRAIVGAGFAVLLTRIFHPEANFAWVVGLGILLVGMSYVTTYLRNRKKK